MFEIFEIQGLHFITMIVQSGETFRAMSREQQLDELRKTVPQFIMDNVVKDITGSFVINNRSQGVQTGKYGKEELDYRS